MRVAVTALLWLSASFVSAQANLWDTVGREPAYPRVQSPSLSPRQLRGIGSLLRRNSPGGWPCSAQEMDALIHDLRYEELSVSPSKQVVLAEAGPGCARGGQGSNGAMWLIQLNGNSPILLAGPSGKFSGWLYAVQPATSHGYRDIVLGWHMSAVDADLNYFRFDGTRYRSIGTAAIHWNDDGGNGTITAGAAWPG
ncbi:MAG: hypothetical protein WA294_15610 [Acidobacteriaceae bacterium]